MTSNTQIDFIYLGIIIMMSPMVMILKCSYPKKRNDTMIYGNGDRYLKVMVFHGQ